MQSKVRRFYPLLMIGLLVAALIVPATAEAQQVHIVQRGENLFRISLRYGTTVQALMKANGISNPNVIYVGQRIVIPGSSSGGGSTGGGSSSSGGIHVVQRGETLSSIAYRYGTSVSAFVAANGLRNANYIYVGQRLRIPGKSSGGGGTGGGGAAPPSGGSKWIEVDLSSQTTMAWQGNTLMRRMVVSTGLPATPTVVGRFRIYAKYLSAPMSGPGYYLPGVPHIMYFYGGYSLHGTYWHNNFGRPMSHGCVNLTRSDAAWLYNWAPIGTLVVVHY